MRQFFTALLLMLGLSVCAQGLFPVNGVADERNGHYVFIHGIIHPSPGQVLYNASLEIKDGEIRSVQDGEGSLPEGATVINLKGKHIYPAFIDLYSSYGLSKKDNPKTAGRPAPQYESTKKGPFGWNEAVRADVRAAEIFQPDPQAAKKYLEAGFASLLVHQEDGIFRGSAALVDLSGRRSEESIIRPDAAAAYSFDKGSSRQNYPNSLMGSIALLRQNFYDAQWYQKAASLPETPYVATLEAINKNVKLPGIFEVNDKLSALRVSALSREFSIPFIIKGKGDEYQAIDAIAATGLPFILPLDFPLPYDLSDPLALEMVPWTKLKHWEMAPFNPRILYERKVPFSLTMEGNKSGSDFLKNLRKSVALGLPEEAALASLTTLPANLLGMDEMLGTLEAGKWASFFISNGELFDENTLILETWSRGIRQPVNTVPDEGINGSYLLFFGNDTLTFRLELKGFNVQVKDLSPDSLYRKMKIDVDGEFLNIRFEHLSDSLFHTLFATGIIRSDRWEGKIKWPDGRYEKWQARAVEKGSAEDSLRLEENEEAKLPALPHYIRYPFSPYGFDTLPRAEKYLIKNASVWTNESSGILDNYDVLIDGGIIVAVDRDIEAPDANIINGTGMHLTSGIIDEHSHMAIFGGVNEGTMSSSSEVRIGDVLNSEDVNIYRQLAGGVTASQLLHGSANPVGGQSALIKLRWGADPEKLKYENAAPFIKFALGENVKQSNWGDRYTSRFPQTRMGVEQLFYDLFNRAQAYMKEWNEYYSLSKREQEERVPPRRDLKLEALAEILHGERFITCHSYVQSEINMLIKVADSMGFRVNTFTHVLEGYKLADKIKAHGAGASTFSDWWAYKFEVSDAIPYNAALLAKMGVITAINSDDREMARRLNQEAAKTIKYGGLSKEEAWKTVTLNPARLLQIDQRCGSIRVGKDADLVLWSGDPLSIYSKAMMTFVDGRLLFDRKRDQYLRQRIRKEREALIQKMHQSPGKEKPLPPSFTPDKEYRCDDLEEFHYYRKNEK